VVEGLDRLEGPFPRWGLPVVRWGGRRTRPAFDSDGAGAAPVLDCRRNGTLDQAMSVSLNGVEVHRGEFGRPWVFTVHRIPLRPRRGRNELTIEDRNFTHAGTTREQAVLYQRLPVLPASEP
jgi:hypothetical protein